jgi:hypothetical protein
MALAIALLSPQTETGYVGSSSAVTRGCADPTAPAAADPPQLGRPQDTDGQGHA